MKRLIQTSGGRAVLDVDRHAGAGWGVMVTRFDPDGWEDEGKAWHEGAEEHTKQTLSQFLRAELRVPSDEAVALAQDILGPWRREWRSRGGEQETRKIPRLAVAFVASLAILLVLACLAIGLVIWLFAT